MAWALVSTTVGQLGSLIASEFAGRLGSLFASDFASIVNVKEEVEKLERKFYEIQAKLNDAEERQVKEKAVKLWVRGRKLFLVLDDVWTEDSMLWEPFRLALQNAAQGSRILVTTRKSEVADVMGSAKRINLEELSNDDCWLIFSTIAFSDRDSEQRGKDDSQRCELGELKYLNHLQGTLTINRLGNVVDACEAKNAELKKKIGLRDLYLHFSGENVENHGRRMENDISVLNALEPPPGLEKLEIVWFRGTTIFPNWMMSLAKLKSLTLTDCENLGCLPPLGKLQFLEVLLILGPYFPLKKEFEVNYSPILGERYQRGTGEDWAKISHIPTIQIDHIAVQRDAQEVIRRDDEEEFDQEEQSEDEEEGQ
nr:putative disease resistance protein rga3 [Quercus suber]